jgi:hypothetical protein
MSQSFRKALVLCLMTAGLLTLTGCLSDEPENSSSRPWNSVRGWENSSVPSTINQGR